MFFYFVYIFIFIFLYFLFFLFFLGMLYFGLLLFEFDLRNFTVTHHFLIFSLPSKSLNINHSIYGLYLYLFDKLTVFKIKFLRFQTYKFHVLYLLKFFF